jgi:3-hydroxyacyl-[acyl-carrier-protein] dehydratase
VRFRDPVLPGSKLVVVSQLMKVRRGAMIVCRFQCFVHQTLVCEGVIKGVPLPTDLPSAVQASADHAKVDQPTPS